MIKNIGILGGGQLGRMLAIAVHNYGLNPVIYTNSVDSPALQVTNNFIVANYNDINKLEEFARKIDVLTFEFENLPYEALEVISKYTKVMPGKHILKIAQNRVLEKQFLRNLGVNIADFIVVENNDSLNNSLIQYPSIIKTSTLGYDGRGQKLLRNSNDIPSEFQFPAVIEQFVSFDKEVSIIVVRNQNKEIVHFPIAENVHKDGILDTSKVKADIDQATEEKIIQIANLIATELDLEGILAIEFFILGEEVYVNELAPRAHNSGHWSMDCCNISQFDALVRIICGLPLPEIKLLFECTMRNIIGDDVHNAFKHLENKDAKLYLYGKGKVAKGRKMGHFNIVN